MGKKYGAYVPFLRPKKLSKDNSSEWSVWQHAIDFCQKNYHFEDVIILPVVSPLRKLIDINKSIKLYKKNRNKCVITVTNSSRNPYFNMVTLDKNKNAKLVIDKKKNFFRRQDAPKVYDICTVSYILNKKLINKHKSLFDCKLVAEIIPKYRSLDIDDKFDLEIARSLYGKKIKF
jgi:CMP-N-acetylneuraminic acid synthetase